jgi:dihydropteroate synthase
MAARRARPRPRLQPERLPGEKPPALQCGRFFFDLKKPLVMGVVNVTPDSFSDGGRFLDAKAAVDYALRLAEDGADILDIGGESSRPGALPVSPAQELDRIAPVLAALKNLNKPVSVDTRRPEVMKAALAAGASMINDIEALGAPGAIEAVAKSDCAVCLMHKQGEPATMQRDPHYDDVVGEVKTYLEERVTAARAAGIAAARIIVDPGFGFGKTVDHNLELLRRLKDISSLPVLAGLSRKSTLARLTGRPAGERLAGSLAMALLALQGGARILRVHDVKETRDVIAVWEAFKHES